MAISPGQPGHISFTLNPLLKREFDSDEEVRKHLEEVAELAVQYAYNLAAKASGDMANSIRFAGFEMIGGELHAIIEVGAGAEHWVFVEYGTGQRGSRSRQPKPGLPAGYAHGGSPGMMAQPFMRPALIFLGARVGM